MMKPSEPSDIGDYISELFAERWRDHDRAVLRHTLIGMVGGQIVNARSLSTKYSIPESKVLAAFATDRYDLNGSGDVVDDFCQDQWNSFCTYVRFYESFENACPESKHAAPIVIMSIQVLFGVAQLMSDKLWK